MRDRDRERRRESAKRLWEVNTHGGEVEIGILESLGVVVDEVDAVARASVDTEGVASPIATQCQVNDDIVGAEMLLHTAGVVGEEGVGCSLYSESVSVINEF